MRHSRTSLGLGILEIYLHFRRFVGSSGVLIYQDFRDCLLFHIYVFFYI